MQAESSSTSPSTTTASGSTPPDSSRNSNGSSSNKKRRLPGACDLCKKKKIRCDSGQMMGNRCSNCIAGGFECTHDQLQKNLGAAKGYVENLEQRLEKMESLLNRLLPGVDLAKEAEAMLESDNKTTLARNDDDDAMDALPLKFSKLQLDPAARRYFGKSSDFYLVQSMLNERKHFSKPDPTGTIENRMRHWKKRNKYWNVHPWQEKYIQTAAPPPYKFPPNDLLTSLIDLYFHHVNSFFPLLHRPTFERQLYEKKHLSDHQFGATVLLVCALASRYSDDALVFSEGPENSESAGWHWFQQVKLIRTSMYNRATLHELQMYALSILYSSATAVGYSAFVEIGIAVSLAVDVGAHRRNIKLKKPDSENELWKRAFWCIMSLDRFHGCLSGRSTHLHDMDFDQDYPAEVDDEYWDHVDPEKRFKQPFGQPSRITAFVEVLKLYGILERITTTVYGIRKSPLEMQKSDQQIIADIDSEMNSWMENLPEHLKWAATRPGDQFYVQSAYLHVVFYHIRIFAHRPFIPTPTTHSMMSFSSLAMCTNAARSVAYIIESPSLHNLCSVTPVPTVITSVFMAGTILLLSTWTHRRSRSSTSASNDMAHVHACLDHIKNCETRWNKGGKLWDILAELIAVGEVVPDCPNSNNRKRSHDADSAEPTDIVYHDQVSDQMLTPQQAADLFPLDFNNWSGAGFDGSWNPFASFTGDTVGSFGTLPATGSGAMDANPDSSQTTPEGGFYDILTGDGLPMWPEEPGELQVDAWGPFLDTFSQMTQQQGPIPLQPAAGPSS